MCYEHDNGTYTCKQQHSHFKYSSIFRFQYQTFNIFTFAPRLYSLIPTETAVATPYGNECEKGLGCMNDWENKATESPRCQIYNVSRTWVLEFSKILVVSFVNRLPVWKIGCLLKHQQRKTWPINPCSLRGPPMIGAPPACRSIPMIAVATVLSSGICHDSCGHCTIGCLNSFIPFLQNFSHFHRIKHIDVQLCSKI